MKHGTRSTGLMLTAPLAYRHLMFLEGEDGGGSPDEEKRGDQEQGDPADLGDAGKKALTAERTARKAAEDSARALQAKLDEIAQQNMSDLDRARAEAEQHKEAATRATSEALRWRTAAKHGISDEDAETFLTGTDEVTLTRQAERLSALASSKPSGALKPDPSQGAQVQQRAGAGSVASVMAERAAARRARTS